MFFERARNINYITLTNKKRTRNGHWVWMFQTVITDIRSSGAQHFLQTDDIVSNPKVSIRRVRRRYRGEPPYYDRFEVRQRLYRGDPPCPKISEMEDPAQEAFESQLARTMAEAKTYQNTGAETGYQDVRF